jgi:hypothetical protein
MITTKDSLLLQSIQQYDKLVYKILFLQDALMIYFNILPDFSSDHVINPNMHLNAFMQLLKLSENKKKWHKLRFLALNRCIV